MYNIHSKKHSFIKHSLNLYFNDVECSIKIATLKFIDFTCDVTTYNTEPSLFCLCIKLISVVSHAFA